MITGMMNESGGLVCWPVQYFPFFNIFLFGFLSDDFKFLFETINLFFNLLPSAVLVININTIQLIIFFLVTNERSFLIS
jgi:hypothetical protein